MVGNSDGPHGLNELHIGGARYLLVGVSSSHLAGLAEGDVRGRSALAEWRIGTEAWAASYDLDALFDPIWNPRTLCGREWIEMESGDGPPFDDWRVGVYAPSCKNCLRIVSQSLEDIAPDERIPLIVGLVVTEVLADTGTVVIGVPGQQLDALRAAIRQRLRSIGVSCRTFPIGSDLHVVSEQVWDDLPPERKSEMDAQAASAFADVLQGRPVLRQEIVWDTWSAI
jgi:hypothetical protein